MVKGVNELGTSGAQLQDAAPFPSSQSQQACTFTPRFLPLRVSGRDGNYTHISLDVFQLVEQQQ